MADEQPKRRTVQDVFRDMYGSELADTVERLKNKNAIGSAESDRREHARRQQLDEEAKRQAEEDEARRYPDP